MALKIDIKADWEVNGGSLENIASTQVLKNATEIESPFYDELIENNRGVYLECLNTTESCTVHITVPQKFLIKHITLVTDADKIEIFYGLLEEYSGTRYGEEIVITGDSKIFGYTLDFKDETMSSIMIKFIIHIPFWIYSIHLQLLPDQNPTKMPSPFAAMPSINLDNVEAMLTNSNQKLSPSAEKCKDFMQTYMRTKKAQNSVETPPTLQMLMSFLEINDNKLPNSKITTPNESLPAESTATATENSISDPILLNQIKFYIDCKMQQFETVIRTELQEMEQRQSTKLNQILDLIQDQKKS